MTWNSTFPTLLAYASAASMVAVPGMFIGHVPVTTPTIVPDRRRRNWATHLCVRDLTALLETTNRRRKPRGLNWFGASQDRAYILLDWTRSPETVFQKHTSFPGPETILPDGEPNHGKDGGPRGSWVAQFLLHYAPLREKYVDSCSVYNFTPEPPSHYTDELATVLASAAQLDAAIAYQHAANVEADADLAATAAAAITAARASALTTLQERFPARGYS
jgi:hypothetical protein